MEQKDTGWFAVVNPHAGSGKTLVEWHKAENRLKDKKIKYKSCHTAGKNHAKEIAYAAAEDGYRCFIAVGGDGTAHEVLDGIMHYLEKDGVVADPSEFYLAVIPIGSGNDWIKAHNIPHNTEAVVDLLAAGSFTRQDVVKASLLTEKDSGNAATAPATECTYMVNIGGVGFDARVCERVNRQKDAGESGKLLYIKSLVYNIFHYKPSGMEIYCDGEKIHSGGCFSIAFGIGQYSGGGLRQTPEAVIDDGLLDVTVIPPVSILRILKEAVKLFNGKLLTVDIIKSCRARTVTVVPVGGERPELVEVDGEILGNIPIRLEVLPRQLNVLHRF